MRRPTRFAERSIGSWPDSAADPGPLICASRHLSSQRPAVHDICT